MAVFVDSDDVVWAGTRSRGLNRFDPNSGEYQLFETPVLTSNRISAITGDPDGTLWIGTFGGGLNRMADGTVTHYRHDPADPSTLGGDRVLAITRDRRGTLWIGTEDGGLNRFVPETGQFERFTHDPANPESISSDTA